MNVFKPKKKQVSVEETDTSLPPFRVDVNGFLMFLDEELGGCGIFEVIPAVWSAAWSYIDDYRSGDMIDDNEMISSSGVQYADARRVIVPVWVAFLNSLLPKDSNTSQTHIQILGKKTRTEQDDDYSWRTMDDYLFSQAAKDINSRKDYIMSNDCRRLRALDYFKMLGNYSIQSNQRSATFDIGHATSYETRWYIIVSYTPSSEGWWYDGRDSDYYMVEDTLDLSHPLSMFSDPRFVDRLTSRIMKRKQKKEFEREVNTADDIFPLATDLTASVIQSRMKSIELTYDRLAKRLAKSKTPAAMPFYIRRLDGREVAATMAFFNDITTPYYEKALNQLQTNTNEVFMGMDADMAVMARDISYVDRYDEDILRGTVDLETPDEDDEEFKRRFANASDTVFGSNDEDDGDEDKTIFDDLGFDSKADVKEMWTSMGVRADNFGKSDDELFLERYGKRRVNMSYQRQQDEIKEKMQKKDDEPEDSKEWDDIDAFMGR